VTASPSPRGGSGRLAVPVLEVFSTFQGEGPRVGERQVFVRLAKCDLRCAFCDTPESYPTPREARVQVDPLVEGDERPANPVDLDALVGFVARLDAPRGLHKSVSVTGGEPLLHPAAVRALGAGARALGLRVHLETGGHRPDALAEVLDAVDEATPDLKVASAVGFATPWDAHARSYELLERAGKCLAVKAVVGATTTDEEVAQAAAFAHEHAPSAPFVLQPATPRPEGPAAPEPALLFRLHAAARSRHPDVRVIPQTHLLLRVR
jgi:organic radical activating enzyme